MTQQEQYQRSLDEPGTVPGPRTAGDDEDVAVGTAHAPHHEDDPEAVEAAQSYPGNTYASDSADDDPSDASNPSDPSDSADRDDAEDERAEDERAEDDARADDPFDEDTRTGDVFDNEDARTDREDRAGDVYDDAVRENEARDAATDADEDADRGGNTAVLTHAAGDEAGDERYAAENERYEAGNDDQYEAAEDRDEAATVAEESRPGSVDVAAVGAVWADGAIDGLRERWRALQLRFIDDPRAVAGEADQLVGEALDTITNALQAQRRGLAAWQDETGDDTERLRAAVRAYRDYLDRLLGM